MLLLDDGTVVYSASDLASAAACEYALLRHLDVKLGRSEALDLAEDAMLERAARLGDAHEGRVLDEYREHFGRWNRTAGIGVAEIERPSRPTRETLTAKREETLDALRAGADVVFQAGFFDGRFSGWADFLVREPDGAYAVHDTKLARQAKVTALLQLAAYADQLLADGIPTSPTVHLRLGDDTTTSHRLADLLPVYRVRRARLEELIDLHVAAGDAAAWGDESVRACLRCELCEPELVERRDVLIVAGMRTTQRARLAEAGIMTIDELAASDGPVTGIGRATLDSLRAQASLQVAQHPPSSAEPGPVQHDLHDPRAVAKLPAPDPGDVFFDFEGDPLWVDAHGEWGLEYLFGLVETPATPGEPAPFRAFWAHDRAQEKQALLDFLAYVAERRATHPGMHVYHYAAYEKSALLRLAGRHGVGEEEVDQLLRDGVLVDLYATVRAGLRTGQDSYSIKKLEPLYLSEDRGGDVTTAGDSIVEYAEACAARDSGDETEWRRRLEEIGDYNRLDCLSTLELRDWLVAQAAALGHVPGAVPADDGEGEKGDGGPGHDELAASLLAFAGEGVDRDGDQQAIAMLAAALGYHWREDKPFWWSHFDRLSSHPDEWTDKRSTLVVDDVEVVRPWGKVGQAQTLSRDLR
ncbi:MAG TPA: TM0106 family RecB-like putative nuclease, partial [Jiangellaceae bacterium]|nr:TM0106 family RecB-like putative nuclease [Jiangellaceae bacterium]